jgi:hypothetical protein
MRKGDDVVAAKAPVVFELVKDLRVTLEGVSELLLANPALSLDQEAEKRLTGVRKKVLSREEEAERLEYRLPAPDRRLYIPATQPRESWIEGAKRLKEKGRQASMANAVSAALGFEEPVFPLRDGNGEFIYDYLIDTRPANVRGARILRSRPMIPLPWILECHFTLDEALLPAEELEHIIQLAGKRDGIGDYRPNSKGWFGKYRLGRLSVEG